MYLQPSSVSSKEKCLLCFIPLLYPCWIPWSTLWGIRMSNLP
jgi:hypothetical protein